VPFLYSLFDWNLVAPERRLQLYQATEAQVRLANQAYQQMQREYKAMRQEPYTSCIAHWKMFSPLFGLDWLPGYVSMLYPRLLTRENDAVKKELLLLHVTTHQQKLCTIGLLQRLNMDVLAGYSASRHSFFVRS